MFRSKASVPFLLVLLVGLVCSFVMLGGRLTAEHKDRQVSVAICYDDVVLLAQENQVSPEDWLSPLCKKGLHYLVITDKNEDEGKALAKKMQLQIARSGAVAQSGDAFLMPLIEDYEVVAYGAPGGDVTVPLALVENPWRTGVVMPEGFEPDGWDGPMVKTLYMIDGYRYHYENAEPASENENILFRAVVERGMRLVILTPLIHEGDKAVVSDTTAYTDLLEGLSARIESRGLALGNVFSSMNAPKMNPFLFGGALFLLVAAVVLLVRLLLPMPRLAEWLLLFGGAIIALAGPLVLPGLMQKAAAFCAAMVFPCLAVVALQKYTKKEQLKKVRNDYLYFFALLTMVVSIGLCGGLYVGALLSTRQYMMQFSVFSGVKLSQLLPMCFAGILLCITLFNKKAREEASSSKLPLPLVLLMVTVVVLVLVVLILRSGDNMLPVADLEVRLRNWLEYVLYARPRTKEMLLAFPAVALYLVACKRRYPLLQLPLGVLASVGAVSIVNTFCHIFTPVRVSLIRTFFSTAIGLVIGVVGLFLFSRLLGKEKKDT